MANEADLKLIEIGEFEQTSAVAGSGEEYIVVRKADGKTYKMSTSDFKAFLGTVQVQVPKALAPTDPAPTLSGVYYPTVTQNEAGTPIVYANAGGIEINTADGGEDYGESVQLLRGEDGTWAKVGFPFPVSPVAPLVIEGGTIPTSQDAVYTAKKNIVFKDSSITNKVFSRLFTNVVLYIDENTALPVSVWIDTPQTTSEKALIQFYNYPGGVRTSVGICNIDFAGLDKDKAVFRIRNGANTREVGYCEVDKKILSQLIGVTIADRTKHVLESEAFLQNRPDVLSENKNKLNDGYKRQFHQLNIAVKDLLIASTEDITNVTIHRAYFNGTARAFDVRLIDGSGNSAVISYASTAVPTDPSNDQISASNGVHNFVATIDWTKLTTATLSFASIVAEGEASGTPPFAWTGVKDEFILSAKKVNLFNATLNTGSTSQGGTGITPLSNVLVLTDDSPLWLKTWVELNFPEEAYIISSDEVSINAFLDTFISDPEMTIQFIGTFTTSEGLHKHPNMNFLGYGATLRMANGANANYKRAIFCTTGGKSFAQSPDVSHNNTFIKGFHLHGNMTNNTSHFGLYASGITWEVFNSDVTTYSDVQYITDVVLSDISTEDWKRNGIVAGNGWTGENLWIKNSQNDHGLYIAGGGNAHFKNVYFAGSFSKGALSIAGNNKLYQRHKSDNITIRNVFFDECQGGPHVEIRGKFDNTNFPCNNVLIDGIGVKQTNAPFGAIIFSIGNVNVTDPTPTTYEGFPKGIEIRNLYGDINLNQTLFNIQRAQVKISGTLTITKNRIDRPMIRIAGCGEALWNQVDLSGLNIIFKNSLENYPIIGLYNDVSPVNAVNGLKLDGMSIKSPTNDFYLFDLNAASGADFEVKNLSMRSVVANAKAVVNPTVLSKITFSKENVLTEIGS